MGSVPLTPPYSLARVLRWLLPTLYIHNRTTTTGCSKGPRGLLYPLGDAGLCTSITGSPDFSQGQWGSRSSIHASRQLSDKVLRYLKRVIVTPAVYRSLDPLNWVLTYRHWAGVSNCTHPYGLAVTYVFIKQSKPLCHCDLLLHGAGTLCTEDTGLICRIPLTELLRHALACSARGTCVRSWYEHDGSFSLPFHGPQE